VQRYSAISNRAVSCESYSPQGRNRKRKKKKKENRKEERREGGTHRSEKETSSERRRRLKYFRGSREKAIIEKGFHLAPLFSPARSAGVASGVSSFHLSVLIGHSYFLNSASAMQERARAVPARGGDSEEDHRAEKLRVYASFASTFTTSGIMHRQLHLSLSLLLFCSCSLCLSTATSSSLYTYLRHKNCHGRSQTFLLK